MKRPAFIVNEDQAKLLSHALSAIDILKRLYLSGYFDHEPTLSDEIKKLLIDIGVLRP